MTAAVLDAEREFDLPNYLAQFDADAITQSAAYRRAVSQIDPLAFGLIYLPHHLRGPETGDEITFSSFHLDLFEQAKRWSVPTEQPGQHRDAYVAPRGCGKSTLLFLVLPLWAAAHGWRKFIAAFADSASQAEMHLASFKHELDTNEPLRHDFPLLCQPARRPTGHVQADRAGMLVTKAGFTFAARGIDAASLGMKVGDTRPDLLILDDIEPDESSYSADQKTKRERTLLDAILPLNVFARVVLVGTVTMPGSLVHDLVKTVTSPHEDPAEWVASENFRCHYYPAIITDDDGTERSIWPAKWPMAYLNANRHTRAFRKNMQNDPLAVDGDYWTDDDFRYDPPLSITRRLLSLDPAVSKKKTSDYTGVAVIGYDPTAQRCCVELAAQVKLAPGQLREYVLRLLSNEPRIKAVYIEINQGGDAWATILSPLPVPIIPIHQTEPKEVRAARVLDYYQAGWVAHARKLPAFEEQAVAFPRGQHDDVVDAVVTGVQFFLKGRKQPRRQITSAAYA